MTTNIKPRRGNFYSKIVTFFLMLTIIAIFVVLHFALAKVNIDIQSQYEQKDGSVLVELKSEDVAEPSSDIILGKIIETEFEASASIESQKEEVPGKYAAGYVTIYNNYSRDQVLVATTRLLSPDNKLFRISERVEVPAGKSVEVWAQADQEGEEFITDKTTFIIPGLWEGLHDKIYAETKEGMKLQSVPRYAVSQADLDKLQADIKTQIEKEALEKINGILPEILAIGPERLSFKFTTIKSSQVGENSPQANLEQKIIAYGLVFNPEDLAKVAQEKFKKEIDSSQSFVKFDDKYSYKIIEIYPEKKEAVLEVSLTATVSSQNSEINIDKEKLIGMNQEEISQYLHSLGINDFEIRFFPAWIKTVPKFVDHIIIN